MGTSKETYNKICSRIIEEQETITGSLVWEIAAKVVGLIVVSKGTYQVAMSKEPKMVIDDLVNRYKKVFGTFALDVCKHSVADIIADMPTEDIPVSLK